MSARTVMFLTPNRQRESCEGCKDERVGIRLYVFRYSARQRPYIAEERKERTNVICSRLLESARPSTKEMRTYEIRRRATDVDAIHGLVNAHIVYPHDSRKGETRQIDETKVL